MIDKECDDNKGILPEYRLYVYGTKDNNVPYLVNNAMNKFVNEGHYLFIIILRILNINLHQQLQII